MFPSGAGMKRQQASAQVKKVKAALGHRPAGVRTPSTDISESFRRARSSIGEITTDLKQLRRRATAAVKGPQRPAGSK